MWLASPFSYLCSAAAPPSIVSVVSVVRQLSPSVPRALLGTRSCSSSSSSQSLLLNSSGARRRGVSPPSGGRRSLAAASCVSGDSGSAGMVPDDASSLLRAVYDAKPTPQLCVTITGSGGQALSWILGVPGASSCLLEATVPYSTKACDEKTAAGPAAPGYCSRETAEGLARDAYARAVSLCVAGSPGRGPHVLPERRVIGVGCTAAVVSSHPRRGLHHCFVCAQTAEGLAHYELNLAKGRRDRSGEDEAVSRVVIQAIAEAAGVPVSSAFKGGHLFPDNGNGGSPPNSLSEGERGGVSVATGGRGGARDAHAPSGTAAAATAEEEETEVVPTAKLVAEPDAIEEIVRGRCEAVLIVPGDTRAEGESAGAATSAASAAAATLVLREGTLVRAALPRGTTLVLPGSYNPLHRGHVGLLEAARKLLRDHLRTTAEAAKHSSPASAAVASSPGGRHEEEWAGERCGGAVHGVFEQRAVHGVFEVSVANADKGGLTADQVRRRAEQFSESGGVGWPFPVVITRAPLFSQKARLFPGCAFVVGADTAKRIIDPRYYGNSVVEMVSALAEIRHLGCSFIVGGREDAGGQFLTLEGVLEESGLPESLRGMFLGLDESAFRQDLSSTSIRAGTATSGL